MSEAKSISVQFEPISPKSLSVSVAGPGEILSYPTGIDCPGSCSAKFDEGSTAYLIPSPDPGSLFAGWQGAGCAGSGLCPVAIQEAAAVSARFEAGLPPVESVAPPPRAPGLPTPTVSLRSVAVKGRPALIATVSSPGRLSILSPYLRRTAVEASAPGEVRITPRLGHSGRAALRRSRHHRLGVELTVFFMPSYRGTPAEATTVVTFAAHSASHQGQPGSESKPPKKEQQAQAIPSRLGLSRAARQRQPNNHHLPRHGSEIEWLGSRAGRPRSSRLGGLTMRPCGERYALSPAPGESGIGKVERNLAGDWRPWRPICSTWKKKSNLDDRPSSG